MNTDPFNRPKQKPESDFITWVEPWRGMDADGKEVYADVECKVRKSQVALIQRDAIAAISGYITKLSDYDLITDFMVVHWAWEQTHKDTAIKAIDAILGRDGPVDLLALHDIRQRAQQAIEVGKIYNEELES